jgi:hypothetical protein
MEPAFELEQLDRSYDGSSNGAFALAAILISAGITLVIWRHDGIGLSMATALFACAALAYVIALRSAPRASYFRYVWLDKGGVNHRDGPTGRVARYAWSEIESVETSLEDAPSVQLTLSRVGVRGVPIYLSTASREHARELVKMIRSESAQGAPNPTFQRTAARPLN